MLGIWQICGGEGEYEDGLQKDEDPSTKWSTIGS